MQISYPLFTVIIPQKNRAEYLFYTIKSCMIQTYPNLEIIVSDDCSTDNSVDIIKSLAKQDNRIKLFAHKKHIGMRNNFEFALSQVKPGYVIALGGDDGLVIDAIWRMYEILKKTKKELLTWPYATFVYSDTSSKTSDNILSFKRKKGEIKILSSQQFFNKVKSKFLYQIDECPMIYVKGVASTTLIDSVRNRSKDNYFYHCPTPDGYSGIVLAGEAGEYAYTDEPLSIMGRTTKSQGTNYRRSDESSIKESQEFFNDNINKTMHRDLASQPYSPLEPLMTADYLMTAKDLQGWPGILPEFTIKELINKTFNFLENANFERDRLVRELHILKNIAIQHGLEHVFNKRLKNTKRRLIYKKDIYGFVITHSIRFNGSEINVHNVYDASIAIKTLYELYKFVSIHQCFKLITNTAKVLLRNKIRKTDYLPII